MQGETVETWNGFRRVRWSFRGQPAFVTEPAVPASGRPWVWRASFPEFHAEIDVELLRTGWHVAYLDTGESLGCDAALDAWDAFYEHVVRGERALAPRPALEAVSRGGLYAYRWAARHPERVAALYADTPVMDLKSWPGGRGKGKGAPEIWKVALARYGFRSEEEALAFRGNPLDLLPTIARAKIPLRHVISLNDRVVPAEENTLEAARRLKRLRAAPEMEIVTVVEGTPESDGHHFPLPEVFASAEFVRRHSYSLPGRREYFTPRDGLPNAAARFATGRDEATVAFLGGSITAAGSGWRDEVERWLTERFPGTRFTFVRAGIPSLGSVPHAFRLERDVLSRGRIDLCFVEAAVNDPTNFTPPERMVRGMEGVVRHLRRAQPACDVVHLHFAMPEHLADYRAGKTPEVIRQHERVAARYGNPSLDLAREVTERIAAGEFTWERDFRDLHPSPFGHRLYANSIARLLDAAFAARDVRPKPHALPAPVDAACYDAGRLVPPDAATDLSGFRHEPRWKPADGAGTRPGFVDVPALIGTEPGASFTLSFAGTAVGLLIAAGPDAGRIEYEVDGRRYPPLDAFTPWSKGLHLPWALVLADGLRPGPHLLRVRLLPDRADGSKGAALRVLHFLVNDAAASL